MSPVQRSDPSDPVDQPRAARAPDGAAFAASLVGGRRAWPPVIVVAFVALVAGMVVIGIGGRGPAAPVVLGSPVAVATSGPTTMTAAPHMSPGREGPPIGPELPGLSPGATPGMAPILSSPDGPIELKARRHPETMYVHGDVFVERVTWVFVSLQDVAGRVAGWASVSVPGAAGPGAGDGPTLRFDVELAISSEQFQGPLWVQANAYDSSGILAATTRLGMRADGSQIDGPIDFGARPGVFFPQLDASWDEPQEPAALEQPAAAGAPVTGATIAVAGRLVMRAYRVEITLEASGRQRLASAQVDTSNRDGGVRPIHAPTLDVRLEIPSPRPVGRAWVVITAYDAAGNVIGAMARSLTIGELLMDRSLPAS